MRNRRGRLPESRTVRQAELQLSIFLRAGDLIGGRPAYHEIIDLAHRAGLSGASVVHGLRGFGDSAKLRPPGLIGPNGSEPVLIEILDSPARVHAFLPVLDQLLGSGLVVLKSVTASRRAADVPDIAATASP
jgi:uncharacterized protein